MTYATLMVHLDLGASNEGLLQFTGDLAERFGASVIGIAACQPMQMTYGDGYLLATDIIEQDRLEVEKELKTAEERFRSTLHNRARDLEWRSTITFDPIADYVAHEARSADLILVDPTGGDSKFDPSRRLDVGDLVMRAGRPVLVVAPVQTSLNLTNVVIGWKDTREAQRAVCSAIPLLKKAEHVTVVEIAPDEELAAAEQHVGDVASWLKRHGVPAQAYAAVSDGSDAARLAMIAKEKGAGLLVAGAYGHNRLREWVLGGVTRDLLLRGGDSSSLVAH